MRRLRAPILSFLCAVASATVVLATPPPPERTRLPPLREQDHTRQEWLAARLERVLPTLMRRHGVAMWIVVSREYNRRLVEERRPASIAIDVSHTHAFSDGLSAGEREQLEGALGP